MRPYFLGRCTLESPRSFNRLWSNNLIFTLTTESYLYVKLQEYSYAHLQLQGSKCGIDHTRRIKSLKNAKESSTVTTGH
jgi:hypothetical protein